MEYEEAKQIVLETHLNPLDEELKLELMILDEYTVTKDYGWIFFYTTKLYHQTNDAQYALAGNCPILYNKNDGTIRLIYYLPTVEANIDDYERNILCRKIKWSVMVETPLSTQEKNQIMSWAKAKLDLTSQEAFNLVRNNTTSFQLKTYELADELSILLKQHRTIVKIIKEEGKD